ncbi:MAG: hypothetical protein NT051_02725 [Candidatus Micrarchaeota archaeon]|nr:hypothetical protein [Candidatus Micrarchaeota archaeon]
MRQKLKAQPQPDRIYALNDRLNLLQAKQKKAGPIKRVWLDAKIKMTEKRLNKALNTVIDKKEFNSEINSALTGKSEDHKGMSYDELKAKTERDYLKAWEKAEDESERKFITTGKYVDPKELFVKPSSMLQFESAAQSTADEARASILDRNAVSFGTSGRRSFFSKIKPAHISALIASPIVGAVAGFFFIPTSILSPIGGGAIALACMIVIVITDGRQN